MTPVQDILDESEKFVPPFAFINAPASGRLKYPPLELPRRVDEQQLVEYKIYLDGPGVTTIVGRDDKPRGLGSSDSYSPLTLIDWGIGQLFVTDQRLIVVVTDGKTPLLNSMSWFVATVDYRWLDSVSVERRKKVFGGLTDHRLKLLGHAKSAWQMRFDIKSRHDGAPVSLREGLEAIVRVAAEWRLSQGKLSAAEKKRLGDVQVGMLTEETEEQVAYLVNPDAPA